MAIGAIAAIVVVVGIIIVGAMEYDRRRKRAVFGPEFDILVQQEGSPRAADRELSRRRRAYSQLALRPLGEEERARYTQDWRKVQESFVDDPVTALNDAEALVVRLGRFRGYPGGSHEEFLELLSIPHTSAVAGYRDAVQVRQMTEQQTQPPSTEDMRQAFQKYAALFDDMLAGAVTDNGPQHTQSSDSRKAPTLETGP
ncbi:hypothetical protein KGQ20_07590 [Catenulispora sp. NF23]|uniref:Secreted protein n=1 Tax=Catenulispora pinistramenti TaxID=2705254 RepID=A0ABS5KNK3_9ACTN|nr:hypothetical protein [Catenulispora pinistramenti]MBS2532633.1 hypothetical protein [Catenulispora pinistramenti]MBS2547610.1 hypothetical protein [Catenulispora pinistramenti]